MKLSEKKYIRIQEIKRKEKERKDRETKIEQLYELADKLNVQIGTGRR